MGRRAKPGAQAGEVTINMTPMIDMVFQLIIFFILAGQAASTALAKVDLYRPIGSQAQKWSEKDTNRAIVNVPSLAGDKDEAGETAASRAASGYMIGNKTFAIKDVDGLTSYLRGVYEDYKNRHPENPEYFIEIRADKRVAYVDVEPVLYAASQAGIPKMNLTAILAGGERKE